MTTSKEVEMGHDHQPTTKAQREEDDDVIVTDKAQPQATKREIRCKWVLCVVATTLILATVSVIMYLGVSNKGPQSEVTTKPPSGERGGLSATCLQLQDTPLDTVDPRIYFNESTLLKQVAPPQRTGTLRDAGALPTGHFACNQINHGPLTPIRQFPHSALMTVKGITYDAYTLHGWNQTERQDPFYQLTPGMTDAPWEKVESVGVGMKQMVSGPDGAPFAEFTGLSGIRVGIADAGEPSLTDFGEMYADFIYIDTHGGTMELPIVRGAAMLTHIFTDANPLVYPYCLVAVNGEDADYDCPEERSTADRGSAYTHASCNNITEEFRLVIHLTKPISYVSDVQWAASEDNSWETDREMITCNATTCNLSEDGYTVRMTSQKARGVMLYAVNIIGLFPLPQHDYGKYWVTAPGSVECTDNSTEMTEEFGARQPPWFYGSADVNAVCNESRRVEITTELSQSIGGLEEIQYIVGKSSQWNGKLPWMSCTPYTCSLSTDRLSVRVSVEVTYDDVSYAVNVIGQYVTEVVPFNWRRQPKNVRCDGQPVQTIGSKVEINSNYFVFELAEPLDTNPNPSSTRKFAAFFSEEMNLVIPGDGSPGMFSSAEEGKDKFTGVMQLVYAGSSLKGDFNQVDNLKRYAGVYSSKPKTRFCVDDDKGYISFDWNKQGGDFYGDNPEETILTVVLPHQEPLLPEEDLVNTPFGFKGYTGDYTVMEEDLPRASMEPDPKAVERIKEDPNKLQDIRDAMDKDSAFQTLVKDCSDNNQPQSYWAGKSIGMVTRLASISRAFGTDHYIKLDEDIKICLDLWLGVVDGLTETNSFRYDTVWGGMFIRSAEPNQEVFPWTNFGFVSYADHHFHLGYWLYAIAYYATYHQEWATQTDNYNRILALARDVGNPSKADKFFPTVRQKDWYLGSSWATGIGGGSRQEESSSESINCYHALAALGEALNHPTLRAIGQLTLATEIRATRTYFHVRNDNQHLFPPLIRKYGVIGQLQEDGIFYYTLNWDCSPNQFPQRHGCIVGIQLLPIISVSHLYMDQEWALNIRDICTWAINPSSAPGASTIDEGYTMDPVVTNWSSFCHAIMSKCDSKAQSEATDFIKGLETSKLEPGSGLASMLLFIYEST